MKRLDYFVAVLVLSLGRFQLCCPSGLSQNTIRCLFFASTLYPPLIFALMMLGKAWFCPHVSEKLQKMKCKVKFMGGESLS